MAINRPLPCPECHVGVLSFEKGTLHEREHEHSVRARKDDWWEVEWTGMIFTAVLKCRSAECGEFVACIGDVVFKEVAGEDRWEYEKAYRIRRLFKSPSIVNLPTQASSALRLAVQFASSHIWNDHAACANGLRATAELLLDEAKVPRRHKTSTGKLHVLTVHKRIEKVAEREPDSAHLLMAVKWLGNEGSHSRKKPPTHEDLLDCFEMIEAVADDMLAGRRAALNRSASRIRAKREKGGRSGIRPKLTAASA